MPSDPEKAYLAFTKSANRSLPRWDDLPPEDRIAWNDAVQELNRTPGRTLYEARKLSGRPWQSMPLSERSHWEAAALAVTGPQTVKDWQVAIHEYAKEKGWWDKDRAIGDIFILFASEVHEAYDEYRNGRSVTEVYINPDKPGKPEGVPTELADVVIRILDFYQWAGIDLQEVMAQKHAFNLTRPYRHGGKRT